MILLFLLRLIAGLALTWCLLPRRFITSGFFRIQMLVTLGLSVLGFLMLGAAETVPDHPSPWERSSAAILFILMAVGSFIGSVMWTLERRTGGLILAIVVAVLAIGLLVSVEAVSTSHHVLGVLSGLSAAWLNGGVMCAMLLGHWYLTATGMQLIPLQTSIKLAGIAVVFRCVMVGAAIFLADQVSDPIPVWSQTLWMSLRVLAGLLAPLVLIPMAWGTLRYRNTQAATGVLFATSVLVFIGESAALLLTSELKWPL